MNRLEGTRVEFPCIRHNQPGRWSHLSSPSCRAQTCSSEVREKSVAGTARRAREGSETRSRAVRPAPPPWFAVLGQLLAKP